MIGFLRFWLRRAKGSLVFYGFLKTRSVKKNFRKLNYELKKGQKRTAPVRCIGLEQCGTSDWSSPIAWLWKGYKTHLFLDELTSSIHCGARQRLNAGIHLCSHFLMNSTRRFCALPASVLLSATGTWEPLPTAFRLKPSTPIPSSAFTTASARC